MTREDKLAETGDYVLGLLEGAVLADFEARLVDDPELAGMVRHLSGALAELDAAAGPEPVSAGLWSRIDGQIAELQQQPAPANVVDLRPAPATRSRPQVPWYRLAVAASVLAALGVGFLAGRATDRPPEPTVIAVLLNPGDASPGAIVEAFSDSSIHLVPLENFAVPQGQVLQVWTLPDPATGPVSLGTLSGSRDIRLDGPDLPLPQPGQLYEITLEPAPGSPTGRPTGPILAKGNARQPIP